MNKIFVDTSAFAALADNKDDNHAKAVAFNRGVQGITLITSNYVLDELHTLLLINAGYLKTVQFKARLDLLITERLLRIVWISEALAEQTWNIFEQFNTDKQWSFTDCSSYVVMKNQGITEVFTFDHHFSQMGFTRLPIT
ncbi:MAG: type II toxin-antitoxin system VapC family toxin [Leptolyngbyaceae cyanobacterium RM1_406_9]|nr:type II toxin-antitoxin system VapC family toxin [Leptolyngbyaceae cyanobacterium SM1_4_3]NJO72424.1 type II toxin-antitoxin system VapC family toxin [Leptolyngbyaceae cyanobacterium RM1_406_9]